MPRQISVGYRQSLESQYSEDVDLIFITITHDALAQPIRVVCDTVDYIWDQDTGDNRLRWIGLPFDIALLTDDDSPPKAQLQIQNVDEVIGRAVDAMSTPARLRIQLLCSADFDLSVRPRVPLESVDPSVEYDANALFLSNVQCNAMQLTGDVTGWDYLQRTWPGRRATKAALPALFR